MKPKEDRSSNVKVVVRVRPTNGQEKQGGYSNVVKVIDDHMLVFDPKCDSEAVRFGRAPPKNTISRGNILDRRVKDLRFVFDRVFDKNATNSEVFENTTRSVIHSVLEGFNCSVFAYGATSAGKTHTMLGSPKHPGVIFLTMKELYEKITERKDEFSCDVSVSYLEIYNETARDLLLPTTVALAVREDPQKGVCVTGLSLHKPRNAEEILGMLEFGNQNRTQHPTDANKQSSRSHAVFQVFVRQQPKGSGLSTDVKVAKMSLIDLAGSERATVTTNRGARFREGANINRSLLALGNCINALAENKTVKGKKDVHIPYRDSKLTRLLKDSLGGNCKTIMIAALSPSSMSYEDTYNTLKYANRAKDIKSTLKSNVISVDFHVSKYAKIVEELKQQVEDLKDKMKRYESGEATPMKQQKLRCTQRDQLIVIQDELSGIYKSRCLIRKQIIDCEAAEKELKIKLFKRERNMQRIHLVQSNDGNALEESVLKLDRFRSATNVKQKQLQEKAQTLVKQLAANDEKITTTKSRADEWLSTVVDESLKTSLIVFQEARVLDIEKVSARAQTRHLRRYLLMQEKDSQCTERLVSTLLNLVFKQHTTLQSTGSISSELEDDFASLLSDLGGSRRITWADESIRESLDVTSLMNFSSCTPIQTPARKRCILQNQAPTLSDNLNGPQRNLDSIAAMNSVINSQPYSFSLQSEDSNGAANKSDGANVNEFTTDNDRTTQSSVPSDTQHMLSTASDAEPSTFQFQSKVIVATSAAADTGSACHQNLSVPTRRRALALEHECPSESKISRLEEEFVFPDVPNDDNLDSPKAAQEETRTDTNTDEKCLQESNMDVNTHEAPAEFKSVKDRRGTMVIKKSAEEMKLLPHIGPVIPDDSSKKISIFSDLSSYETILDETITFTCQKEQFKSEHVATEALGTTGPHTSCNEDNGHIHAMNATFDVNNENSILGEKDAREPTVFTEDLADNKKPNLNLSGVEPLVDSPIRQPLAVLCENRLNGNAVTPATASAALHLHGLPSMHDNSKFKIKPQGAYMNNVKAAEHNKIDVNDYKSPYSASKSAKSKYAAVPSRLYNENPRYASTTFSNRMKTKNDKRHGSTTLNNPIRLSKTRRRSRTNSAIAPYSVSSIKRHAPSHVLGVRKATEHLAGLKGLKNSRNFAPTTASGVLRNMSSSEI